MLWSLLIAASVRFSSLFPLLFFVPQWLFLLNMKQSVMDWPIFAAISKIVKIFFVISLNSER